MLYLRMWRTEIDTAELLSFDELCSELPGVRPLFSSAVTVQSDLLGLDRRAIVARRRAQDEDIYFARRSGREVSEGEAFTDGTHVFVLTYAPVARGVQVRRIAGGGFEHVEQGEAARTTVQLSYIGPASAPITEQPVLEALSQRLGAEFERHHYRSHRFIELQREGEVGPPELPSDYHFEAARALADASARRLAIAIKASGGLLIPDLDKQLDESDKPRAAQIRETLEGHGLVSSDLVVICKKTQAQVNRVLSRDALESLGEQGLRCACGRAINEERTEEAVGITALGQELLNGSRWMVLLLVEELMKIGVPTEGILVEQQIGGEEMDCFADISGELVFFELKDKVFSLGNAYSFGAKLSIVQPEFSVIVTTEYVGNDAKEHFDRAAAAGQARRSMHQDRLSAGRGIRFVEGLSDLRESLETLSQEIYSKDAETILRGAFEASSLGPYEVLQALATRNSRPESRENLKDVRENRSKAVSKTARKRSRARP